MQSRRLREGSRRPRWCMRNCPGKLMIFERSLVNLQLEGNILKNPVSASPCYQFPTNSFALSSRLLHLGCVTSGPSPLELHCLMYGLTRVRVYPRCFQNGYRGYGYGFGFWQTATHRVPVVRYRGYARVHYSRVSSIFTASKLIFFSCFLVFFLQ